MIWSNLTISAINDCSLKSEDDQIFLVAYLVK